MVRIERLTHYRGYHDSALKSADDRPRVKIACC